MRVILRIQHQERIGKLKHWFSVFLLLVAVSASSYASISINSNSSTDIIETNGVFEWTLNIEGSTKQPKIEFGKFKKVQGPSTSQQFSIINGKISQSLTLSFVLQAPEEPGTYPLPIATIESEGRSYQNQPMTIQVIQSSVKSPNTNRSQRVSDDKSAWIDISVDKKSLYVGDRARVQYKLYFENARNLNIKELPQGSGFSLEIAKEIKEFKIQRETVNGKIVNSALIYDVWVIPNKSGSITLKPLKVEVEIVKQIKRNRDPFSIFNDPFSIFDPFSQTVVPMELISPSVNFEVKPLPNMVKYNNSTVWVGDFDVKVSLTQTEIPVHQSTSVLVQVIGNGVSSLLPPKLVSVQGLEEYPVQQKVIGEGKFQRKEFTYPIIGRLAAKLPIVFQPTTVFNPKTGEYKDVLKDTLWINVLGTNLPNVSYTPQIASIQSNTEQLPVPEKISMENDLKVIRIGWIATMVIIGTSVLTQLLSQLFAIFSKSSNYQLRVKKNELLKIINSNFNTDSFDDIERYFSEIVALALQNHNQVINHPDQIPEIKTQTNEFSKLLTMLKEIWQEFRVLRYQPIDLVTDKLENWKNKLKTILEGSN